MLLCPDNPCPGKSSAINSVGYTFSLDSEKELIKTGASRLNDAALSSHPCKHNIFLVSKLPFDLSMHKIEKHKIKNTRNDLLIAFSFIKSELQCMMTMLKSHRNHQNLSSIATQVSHRPNSQSFSLQLSWVEE